MRKSTAERVQRSFDLLWITGTSFFLHRKGGMGVRRGKKRTWLITFVLLQKRNPFVPGGFFGGWGCGGARILGRSIKKGALKFLPSFMAAGEIKRKLKCMLWVLCAGTSCGWDRIHLSSVQGHKEKLKTFPLCK